MGYIIGFQCLIKVKTILEEIFITFKGIGVEFFNFLVARIFHVQIPGNGRDVIRIGQKAICTCMKQFVFFFFSEKNLFYFVRCPTPQEPFSNWNVIFPLIFA